MLVVGHDHEIPAHLRPTKPLHSDGRGAYLAFALSLAPQTSAATQAWLQQTLNVREK